jgi:drug/metabolite transporter (DMT)-like permease
LSFWGGLFFFLHLWTYIYAAQHTRVANLVLIFSLNPIFTATLSKILIKQAFPKGFWLSYGLSFLGLSLLFKDHLLELMGKFSFILDGGAAGAAVEAVLRPSAERNVFVLGDLIALMSGGLHSLYLISASQARERLSNLEFSLMFYFIGAVGFLVVGLAKGVEFFSFNPTIFVCLMGLIIFPTLLGHFVITYLIKAGNMTQLALAKLIEPPFSVILAFLFLGEEFRLSALLAFACIALALFNLYRRGQPTQSYLRR